jgi:hypothetical protein
MSDRSSTNPPNGPAMMSDGKRERAIWQPRDGDGDSNTTVFERVLLTKWGHPTWKLFTGDVSDEIKIGENEPPHYVYLDDKAAYAILHSKAYSNREKSLFWGFDFNRHGMIRAVRPNRGRPVYRDRDQHQLLYATAPALGRDGTYVFSGEPPEGNPRPASRSKKAPEDGRAKDASAKKDESPSGGFKYRSTPVRSPASPNRSALSRTYEGQGSNASSELSDDAFRTVPSSPMPNPPAPTTQTKAPIHAPLASSAETTAPGFPSASMDWRSSLNRELLKRSMEQAKFLRTIPEVKNSLKRQNSEPSNSGSGRKKQPPLCLNKTVQIPVISSSPSVQRELPERPKNATHEPESSGSQSKQS